MVCLAPRARGDSVRPRRSSGVVVRPLNFTVRHRRISPVLFEMLVAAFVAAGLTAVLGNVLVYILLSRRGVPINFMWSGTPFYLYKLCVHAQPPVPPSLCRLALVTNVAFIAAFVLGFLLFANNVSPMSNNRWRGP